MVSLYLSPIIFIIQMLKKANLLKLSLALTWLAWQLILFGISTVSHLRPHKKNLRPHIFSTLR